MNDEIFQNQTAIADVWRTQIAAVHKERAAAKKAGEPTGSFTRRINEMEEKLGKLLSKGVRA